MLYKPINIHKFAWSDLARLWALLWKKMHSNYCQKTVIKCEMCDLYKQGDDKVFAWPLLESHKAIFFARLHSRGSFVSPMFRIWGNQAEKTWNLWVFTKLLMANMWIEHSQRQ